MASEVIWVVVFAVPPAGSLAKIFEVRDHLRSDVMRETRHEQAKALQVGDRMVAHFGGPVGTHPWAQHLVRAGCVKEAARSLTAQDEDGALAKLISLTRQTFPFGQLTGTIVYDWYAPPSEVGPLPRPYRAPKPGNNFICLSPDHPAYRQVDEWWRRVVTRGRCGQT